MWELVKPRKVNDRLGGGGRKEVIVEREFQELTRDGARQGRSTVLQCGRHCLGRVGGESSGVDPDTDSIRSQTRLARQRALRTTANDFRVARLVIWYIQNAAKQVDMHMCLPQSIEDGEATFSFSSSSCKVCVCRCVCVCVVIGLVWFGLVWFGLVQVGLRAVLGSEPLSAPAWPANLDCNDTRDTQGRDTGNDGVRPASA